MDVARKVQQGWDERKSVLVSSRNANSKIVYWRQELPPFDAEAIGEHTVEATSGSILCQARWFIETNCRVAVTRT